MRKQRRQLLSDSEGENFWPSFADVTSTVALILFVLVLLAYIQNLISGKNLQQMRTEMTRTRASLSGAQQQVTTAEKKLRLLAAEIEAGQTQLKLSQTRVAEQQEVIADSNRELGELRARLSGIAVLRVDVLRKVKESIESQLSRSRGSDIPRVSIAENGNIVVDESVLFETNSHRVKQEGKPFLDSVASAFANVLEDPEVRGNVDVVLVQGHTDERGTVAYNRDLSAKRANAVLDYMFEAHPALEQSYGSYFASSAYSEFRPVVVDKSEQAYAKNRRIEISVVLKDASVRDVIDEYMRNIDPMLQAPAAAPEPAVPATP